jgi:hypothetical protein
LSTAHLVAEHGPAMPGPDLLRILSADCLQRRSGRLIDICGIHCLQLGALR